MSTPLAITDRGGFDRAAQAFEQSIEDFALRPMRPQVRVGHALLWASVLDEAFSRAGGDAYVEMRNSHSDGRVVPGLSLAFNAVKHGAALCTAVRPEVTGAGWIAGPWVFTPNVDDLIRSLDRKPHHTQVTSYSNHVAGWRIVEPFATALEWFEQAINHWSV